MMPPPGWQNNFQQGFRDVSQRFQSGAQQFQQMMQQGYNGAQSGFQNAAFRASTAIRGYSTRFANNGFGMGGAGGGSFSQMSSANPQFGVTPQFGMNGNGMSNNSQLMNNGGYDGSVNKPKRTGYDPEGENATRCTTKTLLGFLVMFLIIAASGGGAGFLLSLNTAKQNGIAAGDAANGNGGAGNVTGNVTNVDVNPATAFNIELVYLTEVSRAERDAFENAKSRWQQIITGDLPLEAFLARGRTICGVTIQEDVTIDDLLIFVQIKPIDGVDNILGSAAPCGFDRSNFPRLGVMIFDSADTASLLADGQLTDVVLHEMGHVLGLGSLWDYPFQLLTPPSQSPVRYLGAKGNAANQALGGPSQAIVESGQGAGTDRGHWKESVYQDELMTGFLSSGRNPLSRLTIAALADLGYTVDESKADTFAFPPQGRRLKRDEHAEGRKQYGKDILNFPRHQLPTREKGKLGGVRSFRSERWRLNADV